MIVLAVCAQNRTDGSSGLYAERLSLDVRRIQINAVRRTAHELSVGTPDDGDARLPTLGRCEITGHDFDDEFADIMSVTPRSGVPATERGIIALGGLIGRMNAPLEQLSEAYLGRIMEAADPGVRARLGRCLDALEVGSGRSPMRWSETVLGPEPRN